MRRSWSVSFFDFDFDSDFAGVGQGICANNQADGPAYKDQGGHQLQHGQRAEVSGAGEALQEAVSASAEVDLCSQAIPPTEGPQWGGLSLLSLFLVGASSSSERKLLK